MLAMALLHAPEDDAVACFAVELGRVQQELAQDLWIATSCAPGLIILSRYVSRWSKNMCWVGTLLPFGRGAPGTLALGPMARASDA
jgi:hypothetical protein